MVRLKVPALLLVALAALGGCSAFFDFNAFSALDVPPAPVLSDYSDGTAGLAKLAEDLGSPAVVDQLKGDDALVQDIKDYLTSTYLSGPSLADAEAQQAAVLFSELNLVTTGGDELVNNVVTSIMTTPPTGNIADIITSIIPASVLADPTGDAFNAMVQGLLDADTAYHLLGDSIPILGAPSGANLGDVAQKAAVAYMMRAVVDAVKTQASLGSDAAAEAQMFLLVTGQPSGLDAVTLADPFASPPGYITEIFNAAGAPLPA
jgi:hypothetical protein